MPRSLLVDVEVTGGDLALVIVVAVIALASLGMAVLFRAEVLRAGEGTPNMQRIAQAVQEGANAYLTRQFRTLTIFAAIAFFVLLALPAHTGDGDGLQSEWAVRIFRSVFFLVGAGFSGAVGYLGMWLAVRANLRVAAAANEQSISLAEQRVGQVAADEPRAARDQDVVALALHRPPPHSVSPRAASSAAWVST